MAARWPERIPESWPTSRPSAGELDRQSEDLSDDKFVALLDSFASDAHRIERLQELMVERGWTGGIRIERAADPSTTRDPRP